MADVARSKGMLVAALALAFVSPVSIEEIPYQFIAGRPVLVESGPGKLEGNNLHIFAIFEQILQVDRVEYPQGYERRRFRVQVEAPDGKTETARQLLVQAMLLKLGLKAKVAEKEYVRPTLIKIGPFDKSMIRPTAGDKPGGSYLIGRVRARNTTLSSLARSLGEDRFRDIREKGVDETGLSAKYDIDLQWDKTRPESIDKVLAQTGLALVLRPFKQKVAIVEQIQPVGG